MSSLKLGFKHKITEFPAKLSRLFASPLSLVMALALGGAAMAYFVEKFDGLSEYCITGRIDRLENLQNSHFAMQRLDNLNLQKNLITRGSITANDAKVSTSIDKDIFSLKNKINAMKRGDITWRHDLDKFCDDIDENKSSSQVYYILMNCLLAIYAYWAGSRSVQGKKNG